MLVRCYAQRHYDEERKTGRYVLLVKKPLFRLAVRRRTFRIAYAFQKRYPTPDVEAVYFVEWYCFLHTQHRRRYSPADSSVHPRPACANPVFLEEILR